MTHKANLESFHCELTPTRYINILYKYPGSRTNTDLMELNVFLRSCNNEFKQFSEATQLSLCKSMYYECFEKGRVILRQGQPGSNFYIILSGMFAIINTS